MHGDERRAAIILSVIALAEGSWCVANLMAHPARFTIYLGFGGASATYGGWILGGLVAAAFTLFAARLPSVRDNLVKPSVLKILALAVAVAAGICEEAVFRKLVMDSAARAGHGAVAQVLLSAACFGAVHAVWGIIGRSWRAAVGSAVVTGALGALLAIVYLAGGRNLAPCVVAHFAINALAEPGLVLAAVRGEMVRRSRGSLAAVPSA